MATWTNYTLRIPNLLFDFSSSRYFWLDSVAIAIDSIDLHLHRPVLPISRYLQNASPAPPQNTAHLTEPFPALCYLTKFAVNARCDTLPVSTYLSYALMTSKAP